MPMPDDSTVRQQVQGLQRQITELQRQLSVLGATGPLTRVCHLWSIRDRRGRVVLRAHVGPVRIVVIPHEEAMANGSSHGLYLTTAAPLPREDTGDAA